MGGKNSKNPKSPRTPKSKVKREKSTKSIVRESKEDISDSTALIRDAVPNIEVGKLLNEVPIFTHLSAPERDKLGGAFKEVQFAPNAAILSIGDEKSDFFVLRSGEALLSCNLGEPAELKSVLSLTQGDHFGEQAILQNTTSTISVIAVSEVSAWKLSNTAFKILFSPKHIAVSFASREITAPIEEPLKLRDPLPEYYAFLKTVELCCPLTNAERGEIAAAIEVVCFPPRTDIYLAGDPANAIHFVVEGCVILSIDSKPDEKDDGGGDDEEESNVTSAARTEVSRHLAGDCFGERALIGQTTTKLNATSAGKGCKLLRLNQSKFSLLHPLVPMLKTKLTLDETAGLSLVGNDDWEWRRKNVVLGELKEVGLLGTGGFGSVTLVSANDGNRYALKAVSKQQVVVRKQKHHIWNEKTILSRMDHPCIVKLYNTFKDKHHLYFLLEPMLGGELSSILKREKMLKSPQARFYAASVVLAFEYIHAQNLIYRDLKPENLLLDQFGLLKVADFGFCKFVRRRTHTVCGTPSYMAPEIIAHKGYGKGVDWWTVGILLFEMLAGHPPFQPNERGDKEQLYEEITKGVFRVPPHFDPEVKSLIKGLLRTRPHIRFGMNKEGGARATDIIKNHPWFVGFDWQALLWRKLKPPFVPKVDSNDPTSNFRSREFRKKEFQEYIDDGTGWDRNF